MFRTSDIVLIAVMVAAAAMTYTIKRNAEVQVAAVHKLKAQIRTEEDTINLLKSTSLVAFIAVPDLMYSVQQIYSSNFRIVPMLIVATLWYMIVVSILSVGQFFIERALRSSPSRVGRRTIEVEPDLPDSATPDEDLAATADADTTSKESRA